MHYLGLQEVEVSVLRASLPPAVYSEVRERDDGLNTGL